MVEMSESAGARVLSGADLRLWLERLLRGEATPAPCNVLLGFRFRGMEEGATYWEWSMQDRFMNGLGVVQGGLLASFADTCMACAAITVLPADDSIAAAEMKINFLKSAQSGTLHGEGRVVRRGKRTIYTEGTITDDLGDIVTRASATFVVL